MWKHFFIYCLILLIGVHCQSENSGAEKQETEYFAKIGQFITGRISKDNQQTVMHHFQLDADLQNKYLFLRLKSNDFLESPVVSVYNYADRTLIQTCSLEEYPECYLQRKNLQPNQKLIILVSAKSDASYNLQTYWGDLEHLTPDSELSFMFDKNTSQLFHLEFGDEKFEQIRIILEPITARQDYDKLKMFLNFGTESQPTEKQHDMESIRVWSDSEALFLSKEQTKGQDSVFLYIVGNAQTIYKLRCEFVRQAHHDLQINEVLYQYLEGKKEYVYHIDGSKIKEYDQYAFKFSVFHGEIGVVGYQDKQLTKPIDQEPFQYMSDLGLYFTKDQLVNKLKNLYIKVWCPDASATYEITLQGRNFNVASEATEDIFQFLVLKEGKKAFFLKYPIFNSQQDESTKKNSLTFTANVIKVVGSYKLNFYACNEEILNWNNCININDEQIFTKSVEQLKPVSMPEVGSKTLYTLEVPDKYLKESVKVIKQVMIVAVFMNNGEKAAVSAIEFSNPNKVKRIREDKAIQEQILGGSSRVYKYENSDPDVQAVQIHYNHISGSSITKVSRKDPRLQFRQIDQTKAGEEGSTVFEIKEDLTKPIYVRVSSLSNTIFTLSATVKHKQHADSSATTLAEDIPYKFKINPFESKLIQIHPIEADVVFQYKSAGGPIYICETLYNGQCDLQSGIYVNSSTNGEISLNSEKKRTIKLRIFNSYDPKKNQADVEFNQSSEDYQLPNRVQVQVFYHAQMENHCEEKKMSQIYSDIFKSGECVKFHIDRMANIQIMTHKQDIGRKYEMFYLCSSPIQPIFRNDRYFIPKSQIESTCQSPNDMTLMIMLVDPTRKTGESIRYQYAVQYEKEGVVLKDGVSYTMKGISSAKESAIKNFYYELIDMKKSTEIILFNHKGSQKFYASILSNQTKLHTEIYENFALISSEKSDYYTNPQIQVTPEIIKMSKCTQNCMMVVSVFSTEPIGTQVQFTMEITSSSVVLGEDEIHTDFIGSGTYQYYRYQVRKSGQSLYVRVSDSNAHCSKIYISERQYPSPSNVLKSEVSGQLVLNDVKKDSYYIGVEALDDCMYSISISESNAKITKMEYGQFYDVKLNEEEIKYFIVKHISKKPFKILTLEKHGSLQIYANQVEITQHLIEEVEAGEINYEDYKFKSEYRNTLVVRNDQDGFCSDCHYLIVVVAKKLTDSSLVLVGENAKLTLPKEKILFDSIVDEDTITSADFYMTTPGKMMTKVHQGQIKIELSFGSKTESYTFDRNKKIYYTDYDFENDRDSFQPIRVKISAITTPALYSFKMQPTDNETTTILHMTPGQHSYLYLSNGKQECLGGYLRNKNEVIYLTVSSEEDLKLKKLIMEYKLKGELTDKIEKQQIGNIMEIKYLLDSFEKAQEYEICLKFNDSQYSMALVAFQNEVVNILPMNTEVLIRNSNKYVFHPSGDLLIDLFVCKGDLDIRYASQESKLKEDTPHDLQKIGIPGQSHALKLTEYQTIFLQIQASEATMNWMPLNTQKEIGTGYFTYDIGTVQYKSSFNELAFIIGGISQKKQTKTQVFRIRYTLYIADSTENLHRAIMCEKFEDSVNKFISTYQGKDLVNKTISMIINKKKITDTFHKNTTLFYNVVADMVLKVPSQSKDPYTQNYKFIYFPQQVSAEVFMQNIIESTNLQMATILIIVGVVGFLIVSCVFIKIILPTIGRIRNRMFVEENNERDRSIPIPPSSDRNQVNDMKEVEMQGPAGTEEQMTK